MSHSDTKGISRPKNTRNVSRGETRFDPQKQDRFEGVSPEHLAPSIRGGFEMPSGKTRKVDWGAAVAGVYTAWQHGGYGSVTDAARALAVYTKRPMETCRAALRRYKPGTTPKPYSTRLPICETCGRTIADAVHDILTTWPRKGQ